MSDQCKHCTIRGDYEKCIKTKCHHHENWIAKKRQEIINDWENEAIMANMILGAIEVALDGREPSDFEMSFPIVRQVYESINRKG